MIKIYTDGSCIHQDMDQEPIGAWVAIILIGNEKIILKDLVKNTSHNRMELLAVIKAIEYLKSNHIETVALTIYTDSQYVFQIKDRKEKLVKNNFLSKNGQQIQNADLVMTLIDLINTFQLDFIKVKAHQKSSNILDFNTKADQLARKLVRDFYKG